VFVKFTSQLSALRASKSMRIRRMLLIFHRLSTPWKEECSTETLSLQGSLTPRSSKLASMTSFPRVVPPRTVLKLNMSSMEARLSTAKVPN